MTGLKKPNWQVVTSWLFMSMAEGLNSGQRRTNPVSGQSGTRTAGSCESELLTIWPGCFLKIFERTVYSHIFQFLVHCDIKKTNEWMKLYLISGLMRLVRRLAKNMLISREKRKAKKTKQINKIIEKEREIQKFIYSSYRKIPKISPSMYKPLQV